MIQQLKASLRLKIPSLKHSVKKIHYFIKRLKNWRVVFQCWKLIRISRISTTDVTTWTYREFLIVSQTINQKKRILRFSIKLMLKSIHLILRTVIVWVSQRKQILSALLIERIVRQFWKKRLIVNRKLDSENLGFQSDAKIFVSKKCNSL